MRSINGYYSSENNVIEEIETESIALAWELGGFIMETQGITNVELGLG